MEKFLNPCDKEYMKMAMLKHEEMFREQVYELHRLYEIQKTLMKNVSNNKGGIQNDQDKWTNTTKKENIFYKVSNVDIHQYYDHQKPDLEQAAEENVAELDEGEIELTLGPSSYCRRRKFDESTPLTSESGLSFSSSSSGSNRVKSTNSGVNSFQQVRARDWGLVEVPNSSNPRFLNVPQVRQDRVQQPPWLFQALKYEHYLNI